MYCRFDNTEETEQSLFHAVKDSVLTYSNVLGCMRKTDDRFSFFLIVFKAILSLCTKLTIWWASHPLGNSIRGNFI